jgi:para-nitrobenzyl esterase
VKHQFSSLLPSALVFMLALPGASPQAPKESAPPVVVLEDGALEGIRFGAKDEIAFLGIPYAAPPVGDRRWKPPQPAPVWSGTRPATQFGAPCPQPLVPWLPAKPWSEDCLYLNVWTTKLSPSAKQPVVVWIHGGGNKAGYSQADHLGPALSRLSIVFVSANYRLGPFGFLAHAALTAESLHRASGNYGLLDQLEALRWVQANISRFGGDPDSVTVMGHSAGAVDTCLLMASPLADGLFQRAIVQSGDCQSILNQDLHNTISYNSIVGSGEGVGERLASDLGFANDPEVVRKMRALPVEAILDAWTRDPEIGLDAVVDGWVLPEQPAKVFAEGRQLAIPVLVGSTTDEATVFRRRAETVEQFKKYVSEDIGKYADEQLRAYPVASDSDVPPQVLRLQNDTFAYGVYAMARSVARSGRPAYLYSFSYTGAGKRTVLGAHHGEELFFLADSFPEDWERRPDDEAFGRTLRGYWTQFAKTGSPNGTGLARWPAYDVSLEQCFELGRTFGMRPVDPRVMGIDRIMKRILAEAVPGRAPSG